MCPGLAHGGEARGVFRGRVELHRQAMRTPSDSPAAGCGPHVLALRVHLIVSVDSNCTVWVLSWLSLMHVSGYRRETMRSSKIYTCGWCGTVFDAQPEIARYRWVKYRRYMCADCACKFREADE